MALNTKTSVPIHTISFPSFHLIDRLSDSFNTSNLLLSGGLDQESYNQGQDQIPLDPYNQEAGDPYGRPRGYEDSYRRGEAGGEQRSRDSSGDGYDRNYGSRDDYGRGDPYGQRGYSSGQRGGYGAAGDSDNYPSSYTVVPVPGYKPQRNCTGSACCVPKCFAEKGSRVSVRRREFCMQNLFFVSFFTVITKM